MCEVFIKQDPRRYQPETRKIRLNGQSTSIRLEHAFWQIIDEIAQEEGSTTPQFLSTLQSEILELEGEPVNFTSLLRCVCLVQLERKQMPSASFSGNVMRMVSASYLAE